MDKTDLVDQLIDRVEQLQDVMAVVDEHYDITSLLIESIAVHGDERMILGIIEDIEASILRQDGSPIEA